MLKNLVVNLYNNAISVDQVAGQDKCGYRIDSLTKATRNKIEDYVWKNSMIFHIGRGSVIGMGLLLTVSSLAVGYSIFLAGIIPGATLVGTAAASTVIALCLLAPFARAVNREVNQEVLEWFASMKHDQIIAFFKEVDVTSSDLLGPARPIGETPKTKTEKVHKNLTLENIKMCFELDTGKKERTKNTILYVAKNYPQMWDQLQSLMCEEKYKGFRDFGSPLYDEKFDQAFLALHPLKIQQEPVVASAPPTESVSKDSVILEALYMTWNLIKLVLAFIRSKIQQETVVPSAPPIKDVSTA